MLTVDPASAVPITLGELKLAGEAGNVDVTTGASGASESFVTESVAEPVLVAASVTQTRRPLAPSARSPAAIAEATSDGLVV
jgi:hypothetical protein